VPRIEARPQTYDHQGGQCCLGLVCSPTRQSIEREAIPRTGDVRQPRATRWVRIQGAVAERGRRRAVLRRRCRSWRASRRGPRWRTTRQSRGGLPAPPGSLQLFLFLPYWVRICRIVDLTGRQPKSLFDNTTAV
jgi:hypothetical protein